MCRRQQAAWTEVWLGLPCPGAGADGPATNAAHSAAAAAKGALLHSKSCRRMHLSLPLRNCCCAPAGTATEASLLWRQQVLWQVLVRLQLKLCDEPNPLMKLLFQMQPASYLWWLPFESITALVGYYVSTGNTTWIQTHMKTRIRQAAGNEISTYFGSLKISSPLSPEPKMSIACNLTKALNFFIRV